jgi:hypothetical protein
LRAEIERWIRQLIKVIRHRLDPSVAHTSAERVLSHLVSSTLHECPRWRHSLRQEWVPVGRGIHLDL